MLNEQELKTKALEQLRVALEDKCKTCKKAAKKNKFFAKQWAAATEEDIEIVYMPKMQKITKFSCRADRYYTMSSSKEYKNESVDFDNEALGYHKEIYNIIDGNITEMMQDLFKYKFYHLSGNKDIFVLFGGKWDTLQFLDFQKGMEVLFEKKYQAVNATKLFNFPEKMTKIMFSNIVFKDWEELEFGTMAGIFLKIKDKQNNPLRMYIGKYVFEDDCLQDFTTLNMQYPWFYNDNGDEVKLK